MKKLVLVFFFLSEMVFAQKRNNVWCFGDSAGIDFNNLSNPQPIVSSVHGRGSCVSIADSTGNLLFYANTGNRNFTPWYGYETEVWSYDNSKMQNGDSLMGLAWYKELLIIPKSYEDSLYYLITFDVTPNYGFCYSIIDLKQNNGLGAVVQKNIFVSNGTDLIDALASVKHGNGRDWWVLNHKGYNATNSNKFFRVLVTPDNVNYLVQQSIGSNQNTSLGTIKI